MAEKKEVKKHVHKLKRHVHKSGNAVLFCALPDCSFKINPALALGKRTICWRCGDEFILDDYSLRLARPHCDNCHRSKKKIGETIFPSVKTEQVREAQATGTEGMSLSQRLNKALGKSSEAVDDEGEL